MKKFLKTFFICLVLVFVFMFFGGSMLLDVSRHFYAFWVFVSLMLAVLISVFEAQEEQGGPETESLSDPSPQKDPEPLQTTE